MRRLKSNIQYIALVLAAATVLSSCGKPDTVSSYGTIQDLYDENNPVVATDNRGNEIKTARLLSDAHPELSVYSGMGSYDGIYVQALGGDLDRKSWEVMSSDAHEIIIRNPDDPTASYSFGQVYNIVTNPNSKGETEEYSIFSVIFPLAQFFTVNDNGEPNFRSFYQASVSASSDTYLNGRATGYRFSGAAEGGVTPQYSYMAYTTDGSCVTYALMVTDKVDEKGLPTQKYVLEYQGTGKDGMAGLVSEPKKTRYEIYEGRLSMAIPSYMQITERETGGYRVSVRDGQYTPLNGSGASVIQISSVMNTREQMELLMQELSDIGGVNTKFTVTDLHYEESVTFMGVEATHLYGAMDSDTKGMKVRKNIPGTGYVLFDIYAVRKNGQSYLVCYYRSEAQDEEYQRFIGYNCY